MGTITMFVIRIFLRDLFVYILRIELYSFSYKLTLCHSGIANLRHLFVQKNVHAVAMSIKTSSKFDFTKDCGKKWTIWKQIFEFYLNVTGLSETENDVQKISHVTTRSLTSQTVILVRQFS